MNKFCTNCGEKLNEKAIVCIKCGVATDNYVETKTKVKQPGKGLGIASMILGIVSTWYSFWTLFIFACILISGEYFLIFEKLALGIILLIIPMTLLIIGGTLGISSRNKIKNGINLTGLILNFISLVLCLLSISILSLI